MKIRYNCKNLIRKKNKSAFIDSLASLFLSFDFQKTFVSKFREKLTA